MRIYIIYIVVFLKVQIVMEQILSKMNLPAES